MWHNNSIFSWNSVEQQRARYCGKTITKVGQGPQYQNISLNFRMNTLLTIALPSHWRQRYKLFTSSFSIFYNSYCIYDTYIWNAKDNLIIIGRYEMQSRTNVHFLVFHLTLADAIVCFITMPMETIWRVVIEVFALQNQRKQEVLLAKWGETLNRSEISSLSCIEVDVQKILENSACSGTRGTLRARGWWWWGPAAIFSPPWCSLCSPSTGGNLENIKMTI